MFGQYFVIDDLTKVTVAVRLTISMFDVSVFLHGLAMNIFFTFQDKIFLETNCLESKSKQKLLKMSHNGTNGVVQNGHHRESNQIEMVRFCFVMKLKN